MNVHDEITRMAEGAVDASHKLLQLNSRRKNVILQEMADEIENRADDLKAANERDMAAGREQGLSPAMLDRLLLTDSRIGSMVRGLRTVAGLKDPIGSKISRWLRPNGLEIVKRRVPIGVIAVIYESRPNVTADTAALCFKTSNAIILRGGKEAAHSNAAIADIMVEGGMRKGLPEHAIQLVRSKDRDGVRELVQKDDCVDLVIPRGGEALIRAVTEMSRVPVIKHYKGVCHVYVDETANPEKALAIAINAKCQRPGVCNAMETLVVHKAIAPGFLARAVPALRERGVELRGDDAARAIITDMAPATEDDWYAEYLDLTLAVRVVDSVEQAVDHINRYGSKHSDAIITESDHAARVFTHAVDSSTVYVNASTRFTDGGEFGMGAEIGISTDKLHARGPMGLEELTTYKYVVQGNGQIRE